MVLPASSRKFCSYVTTFFRNRRYWSSVQNPITGSTRARLYQLLSNRTISPARGKCSIYRLMWSSVFWSWVGFPTATTRYLFSFLYFLNPFFRIDRFRYWFPLFHHIPDLRRRAIHSLCDFHGRFRPA